MNGGCSDPSDYSTGTRDSAHLDIDCFHGIALGDRGHRIEQVARNDEPSRWATFLSLVLLNMKVKEIHGSLPAGIDTPAKCDCEQFQALGVQSLTRIKDDLGLTNQSLRQGQRRPRARKIGSLNIVVSRGVVHAWGVVVAPQGTEIGGRRSRNGAGGERGDAQKSI